MINPDELIFERRMNQRMENSFLSYAVSQNWSSVKVFFRLRWHGFCWQVAGVLTKFSYFLNPHPPAIIFESLQ